LILAGNVPDEQRHRHFFESHIAPSLDGVHVTYLGPVDDTAKNQLLGRASALLMPILWDEPFGIVMAEALACGTPVIGLNRASVPEIVTDGVNGFICDSLDALVDAVGRLGEIDRAACRRIMEDRFSDAAIVDAYEMLYYRLTGGSHQLRRSA